MSAAHTPVALAHRGFSLDGHENTLRAFRAAAELGYRWAETDVNTTSDGTVLAFHDTTFDRVTDTTGGVGEHTWDELDAVRIGGSERLATMSELLREFPQLHFNIDVKDTSSVLALPRVLAQENAVGRVRVTSFSETRRRRTLAQIAKLSGRTPRTSGGAMGSAGLAVLSKLARVTDRLSPAIAEKLWSALTTAWSFWVAEFDTVQLPMRHEVTLPGGRRVDVAVVTPELVDVAHRVGVAVHVWTINDPQLMRELLDLGVDGLVTDRADLLAQVLTERGQWPSTVD